MLLSRASGSQCISAALRYQQEAHRLDRHVAARFLRRYADAADVQDTRVPTFRDGFAGLPRSPIERRLAIALIDASTPCGIAQYAWGDCGSADGSPRPITIIDFAWPSQKVVVLRQLGEPPHRRAPCLRPGQARRSPRRRLDCARLLGGQIVRDAARCAREITSHISQA
jgi:hypothetical protein